MAFRLLCLLPLFLLLDLVVSVWPAPIADESDCPPVSGRYIPRLRSLDRLMLDVLREHDIPGASLAIAKNGRLVFAHGYGWADVENKKPVAPGSRFNLASCSKPITAAAVLKLVDRGSLRLEDKVFVLLNDIRPLPGVKVDPRIREITVRQLLHHAGGLVRGPGPLWQIARRLKVELPISVAEATTFNLDQPLLFEPGTKVQYSNLGFLVLRLVVERASGQDYETFTAEQVLKPMGIRNARLDRMSGYWPLEVHRYFGDKPYRGGHGDLKGSGFWVLSTEEAMRFLTSLDGSRGARVLSLRAYEQMMMPLPSLGKKIDERHNGLGWDIVQLLPDGILFSKSGTVDGTITCMEHLPNGVCWAAFFNGEYKDIRDAEQQPRKSTSQRPWSRIREAIGKIEHWPAHDLFAPQ